MRTNKKQKIKIAMAVIAALAAFSLVVLLVGCSKDKNDPPIATGTGNIGQTESGSFEGEDDPLSPLGTEDGKSTTKAPDKTDAAVTSGKGSVSSTDSAASTTKKSDPANTTKGPEDTFAPVVTTKTPVSTTAKPTPETSKPAVTTSAPAQTTAKAPVSTTSKIIELPFVPF